MKMTEVVKAKSKGEATSEVVKVFVPSVKGGVIEVHTKGEYYETELKDDVILFQYFELVGVADVDGEVIKMFTTYDDARAFVKSM